MKSANLRISLSRHIKQEIFPVKAVDTTAAGDTFTGYFIAARVDGKSVKEGTLSEKLRRRTLRR